MQLHQLEYFAAVAETRHFTAAASRCHIAQPSLSKQIRLLEAELGTQLFSRARGNIHLTQAGETLYPYAKRILADAATAKTAVHDLNDLARGHLRLGATPSTSTALLPSTLARFHTRYPGVDLELHESGSRDLVQLLARGELDIAVVVLPLHASDPSLETEPLLEEGLVLAVRSTHPLVAKNKVTPRDLDGLPMVMFRPGYDLRDVVLGACRSVGARPRITVEGGEMDAVLELAAVGLGAAVVPSMVLDRRADLVGLPFTKPQLTRTIATAYRRDVGLTGAAAALQTLLKEDVEREYAPRGKARTRRVRV